MQFQVPQFIEVEDKIFGPLTFKQFIYILGGLGACYIAWRLLPLFLAAPIILAIAGGAASLAFFEYNGRPFIISVENAFYFFIHPKLYLMEQRTPSQKTGRSKRRKTCGKMQRSISRASRNRNCTTFPGHSTSMNVSRAESTKTNEHVGGVVAPVRTARQALVR